MTQDIERIAILEERSLDIKEDVTAIKEEIEAIKKRLDKLDKIAQQGGGAFHAILLLGGLIGWLIGVVAGILEVSRFFSSN